MLSGTFVPNNATQSRRCRGVLFKCAVVGHQFPLSFLFPSVQDQSHDGLLFVLVI